MILRNPYTQLKAKWDIFLVRGKEIYYSLQWESKVTIPMKRENVYNSLKSSHQVCILPKPEGFFKKM